MDDALALPFIIPFSVISGVLILVVMDDALALNIPEVNCFDIPVLILVVMDDALALNISLTGDAVRDVS